VRLRTIALPAEHGSWGFVLEPICLGLGVAPSWAGLCLAIGVFALFLLRRPLKIILTDWQNHTTPPPPLKRRGAMRTVIAKRFVMGYGLIAVLGLISGVWLAGWESLYPLLIAVPFSMIFIAYDVKNKSRTWQAEFAGPTAFSLAAASIALAGGWAYNVSFALTGALFARAIPSVLYIRARIRLDKNKPHNKLLAIGMHVVGLIFVAVLTVGAYNHKPLLPTLAIVPFVILLARTVEGLSRYRRLFSIITIGFIEVGLGIFLVLMMIISTRL